MTVVITLNTLQIVQTPPLCTNDQNVPAQTERGTLSNTIQLYKYIILLLDGTGRQSPKIQGTTDGANT